METSVLLKIYGFRGRIRNTLKQSCFSVSYVHSDGDFEKKDKFDLE
jgi:hypothetical protein